LIWLLVLGIGIGLFAGLWVIPHQNRLNEQAERIKRLEEERSRLAARIVELTEEPRETPVDTEIPEGGDEHLAAARAQTRAEQAKRLEEIRLLSETQKRLADATLTIDELEAKVSSMTASIQHLEEESKRAAQKEAELSAQLDRANRVINAMQDQLAGSEDRMVSIEVRNRKLDQQRREAEKTLAETRQIVQKLEDLHRRREDLLTRIVGRYREAADEYRNVALRASNSGQADSSPGLDLSRFENAITLADEDLRQFEKLTARAARLRDQLDQQR
jgi:chromosome segregation ATPase